MSLKNKKFYQYNRSNSNLSISSFNLFGPVCSNSKTKNNEGMGSIFTEDA